MYSKQFPVDRLNFDIDVENKRAILETELQAYLTDPATRKALNLPDWLHLDFKIELVEHP